MNRHRFASRVFARFALLGPLVAAFAAASAQEYFDPDPFLPSPWYTSTQFADFGGGVSVRVPAVQILGGRIAPPAQGTFVDSFFDVFARVEVNPGPSQAPAFGTGGVRLFSQQNPGPPILVDLELLTLVLSGPDLPAGMIIRESPTLVSPGRASLRPDAGGYQVSSFFDVFFDLSLNGGETWVPAVQSVRLQGAAAVPEPASLAALGLGAAALLRRRRR